MSPRQTQSLLRAATVALWAAAAATLAAVVLLPVRLPPADPAAVAPPPPASRPSTAPAVTFDDLLDLSLRRPAVAPPATVPAGPPVAAPATPDVRLAGIVAEPGHSFAVFVTAAGETQVRTVGQRAGGAEVLAISPAAVTVRYAGQSITLHLPARPG